MKRSDKVVVYALGGVGELGKNMYVVESGDDIVMIDCGLKFPEEDMLGVDIVIPDIAALLEKRERVRAIVLTHGHEDHIGGLPYILKQLNVPIYGTKLTLGLITQALQDAQVYDEQQCHVIDDRAVISLGTLTVSFFRTNHNIPDSVGIVLHTPMGNIVHTGDFKFDFTPAKEHRADLHRMAQIGQQGVLCLLTESMNAQRLGYTPSDKVIGDEMIEVFHKAAQRVVFVGFASHVHRIQQVFYAATHTGRKVAIAGESMVHVVTVSHALGHLNIAEGQLISLEEAHVLPPQEVVILSTGSHGEPMSALTRLARATSQKVDIVSGDTVIVAASPLPGHEREIGRAVDELYRIGAHVIYGTGNLSGAHVSGHGNQEELKLMLSMMKPQYVIPIHGEYRMLKAHAKLAEQVGIPRANIFLLDNGDMIEFTANGATKAGKTLAGNVLIDGLGIGDVGNIVLRDRKLLSQDGIVVVVVTLSKQRGTILSGPDITTKGFVYVRESVDLLSEANRIVRSTLQKLQQEQVSEWTLLKNQVRDALGRFLYDQTKRRPMILPIIMEV
jgi:ribonuclease J